VRATLAPAPAGVSGELAVAAGHCLERLPVGLLRAMEAGLRANADELAPGALFRGRHSGGCAVGVMLRELAPDAFRFGRIEFWLWRRWRRGVELDVARRFPELHQLQRIFDDAVSQVEDGRDESQPARAVGLWLAAGAAGELRARKATGHQVVGTGPTGRHWRRGRRQPRAASRPGVGGHHRADMETSSCS
jgi:hypothetical protein